MRTKVLKNLLALMSADVTPKQREALKKVLDSTKLRGQLIKELKARGIGAKIDPDNLEKWIELFLKYLPIVLEIILKLVA